MIPQDPGAAFGFAPFDRLRPGTPPGEAGIVLADGRSTPTNLTLSGFNDARATWILGGKAMLWVSNRDGLRPVAQGGPAQRDVYGMCFAKEARDRFKLMNAYHVVIAGQDQQLEAAVAALMRLVK
jgi:hypothetical protein